MKPFITERLILRELSVNDAYYFYLLNEDTEVLQYTGDIPFENLEAAKQFLAEYDQYKRYGLGRWAVIRKDDNAFLGWCGLKYSSDKNEYDIGFRFFRHYWNMGYATEAAKKCIEVGFNKFRIPIIIGRVMKNNSSSIRVLEKIGLTRTKDYDFDGHEGYIYLIKRSLKPNQPVQHQ
ncbi:GNAT family N-acetyltransferase [Flavobacterium alkalisoli]|uniref:GCN5-related N-acetyltransferase n=2 Tax=Flavobacterium TaxID=237 RepID=A0A444W6V2_9FLAO|nr:MULTISPECIES: GNAT family N-acetyltransferase [Flavobacterium]QEE48981.1 GNAT family N-acetyltransferase [Flavobacterium alkalisoli]RYJ41599.1 GCN5-related N-acetyltransferase [Flavobacterium beibuense]